VLRRLILTASTTASLCGAFALYSAFVTPIFTPAMTLPIAGGTASSDSTSRPAVSHEEASRFLAAHAWAAEARYVWTDRHAVFAEEMDFREDAREIELRPFALLLRQGNGLGEDPITVVCESARLKFAGDDDAGPFDRSNPKLGRVIAAVLSGEVIVRGSSGLAINTRDVYFSEASLRVWSDQPLTFAFGKNHGSAHGLELDLIQQRTAPGRDKPAVEGIRTVRLRRNVDMILTRVAKSPERVIAPEIAADSGSPAGASIVLAGGQVDGGVPSKSETAHVTSAGSFEFSLETYVASYQDRVHVERVIDVGSPEHLACDLLRVLFEPAGTATSGSPGAPAVAAAPRDSSLAPDFGSLTFRRLRAEGKHVTLTADERQFLAEMHHLDYDAHSREVTMFDTADVKVFQGPNELRCPEIALVHAESGEIGRLVCRGPGWLESRRAGSRSLEFAAEWTKELRRTPDAESKLDLLEFEGNAKLRQPGRMMLSGELIKAWITPGRGGAIAREADLPTRSDPTETARVERVVALRKVELSSPQLTGTTERLEIDIEEGETSKRPAPDVGEQSPRLSRDRLMVSIWPEARTARVAAPQRRQPSGLMQVAAERGGPAKTPGMRSAVAGGTVSSATAPQRGKAIKTSAAGAAGVPVRSTTTSRPNRQPMGMAADVIRVRVVRSLDARGADQYDVAEVWNDGHVFIQQARGDESPPLVSRGDKLHLRNLSETEQIVRIDGNPATIEDRGLKIEGREVHLDRAKNLAWVEGSGRLRLRVSRSPDGQPVASPLPLNVTWQEKMTFDGDVAKFFANVEATQRDDRSRSRMKCQEMHAIFSRHVSFTEDQSDAAEPEVQRVVCLENVDFENEEVERDRVIGVRRGHVWELALEPATGVTAAQGPGHLMFWTRGRGNRAGLTPSATVRANQSLSADSSEWEFVRIDFAGRMDGNTRDQFTTFRDRVRIVYGPVARPGDVVDRDALPRHGGKLDCNLLEVTQTPSTSAQRGALQLRGSGNARLEGRSDRTGDAVFSARADNISFDQSKGLYTIWSQGRNQATVWREAHLGGSRLCSPGQRIEFNPALNQLRVDKGTGVFGVE
jgi:hypothetical protein